MRRVSPIRWVAESLLAGALLGAAARLAMRVLAWLSGSAGGFSRGGSIEIVVFGALVGAPVALAIFALREWRRWEHGWVGVWTALVLYGAAIARPSPSAQSALAASPLAGWQIVLVFAVVFLAFGLWIDLRWHAATGRTAPIVLRASLAALAMPGMGAGVVPAIILRGTQSKAPPVVAIAGALLVAAGLALLVTCIVGFARTGGGTLAPFDPPRALVARGPYRYSRNPMYVGVQSILWGLALGWLSADMAAYAAAVGAGFAAFVLWYEEPYLEHTFGEDYRRYKARVPRWLGRPRS